MSPPDPVLAIRQRATSLRRRPTDDDDQLDSRGEKRPVASGGTSETQNGTPENHQGMSRDGMV